MPNPRVTRSYTVWAGAIVALVLVLVLNPFVIVGPGERGVVLNFGAVQPVVLGEGLHLDGEGPGGRGGQGQLQPVAAVDVNPRGAEAVPEAAAAPGVAGRAASLLDAQMSAPVSTALAMMAARSAVRTE